MLEILIVNLLTNKLDAETRKSWEATIHHGKLPTYDNTIKFLKTRASILERVEKANFPAASTTTTNVKAKVSTSGKTTHVATETSVKSKCVICNKDAAYRCNEFQAMTPQQRQEKAKQLNLCFNCLLKNHMIADCKCKSTCFVCQKNHHTLLHMQSNNAKDISLPSTSTETSSVPKATNAKHAGSSQCNVATTKHVLLATAVILIADVRDELHEAGVLLDSGSQLNFISERMASTLGLNKRAINLPITGVNQTVTNANFRCMLASSRGSVHTTLRLL